MPDQLISKYGKINLSKTELESSVLWHDNMFQDGLIIREDILSSAVGYGAQEIIQKIIDWIEKLSENGRLPGPNKSVISDEFSFEVITGSNNPDRYLAQLKNISTSAEAGKGAFMVVLVADYPRHDVQT